MARPRQISSTRNPLVVETAKLHRPKARREHDLTLVEGPNAIDTALGGGAVLRTLFTMSGVPEGLPDDVDVAVVTEAVLEKLAGTRHPRGPVAVAEIPDAAEPEPVDSVVLYDISDPGNAGTLIRTAAAFGFQVLITAGTCDVWSPRAVRAAAGSQWLAIPAVLVEPENQLEAIGLTMVATAASGGGDPGAALGTESPVAILVGEEAHGLPDAAVASAVTVSFPMPGGTESLNAAVAGALAMWERVVRR